MSRGPIHLHIDELVLEGFGPVDRHRIADALEGELARMLAGGRMRAGFSRTLDIEHADAGAFTVANTNPAGLGRQIASAVSGSVLEAMGRQPGTTAHPEGSPHPAPRLRPTAAALPPNPEPGTANSKPIRGGVA